MENQRLVRGPLVTAQVRSGNPLVNRTLLYLEEFSEDVVSVASGCFFAMV